MVSRTPRISVITATYNWSDALRCSMTSALAQTFDDFELLVVGDACTDDSQEVARSFSDPRVQWHNLPLRTGNQTGPNNHALRQARGAYIAYLGHDDIWHPHHLASLIETIERRGADFVSAVCVLYGPPNSGVRGLSGIFVEGEYRAEDFTPPSSWMHRRELIDRIGDWRTPESTAVPTDCDFLRRAYAAGARIVSSDRLTVFKFNSAWRRDSYVRRDTSEQRALWDRLHRDAEACVEAELVGALRSARECRLIEVPMPVDRSIAAEQQRRDNARFRGLTKEEFPPLRQTQRFPADDQYAPMEWHPLEHSSQHGAIRWSGPSPASTIVLPVSASAPYRVRIRLLNLLQAPLEAETRVIINDRPAPVEFKQGTPPEVTLSAMAHPADEPGVALRIRLEVTKLRAPYFYWHGTSEDRRWLGVCLNWVEVEPLDQDPRRSFT